MLLHVGIDDTDSPQGGCTTYVTSILTEKLLKLGARFIDYPILLRLNPNVPWKTRGNASTCLRFTINKSKQHQVKQKLIELIDLYGEFQCDNTNPGIVILEGEIPKEIKEFSHEVVQKIVKISQAKKLIQKFGLTEICWKNCRGVIGALAAIGGTLENDHTYELLTYRNKKNWNTPRRVNIKSIKLMDKKTKGKTFNNLDEKGQSLIMPNGPDPVLYGVRGETPEIVYQSYLIIQEQEEIERWMIYRTNQGTNAHLTNVINIDQLITNNPAIVSGKIYNKPKTIKGGHVIFSVKDATGMVDCAAYEPTGKLRHIVWKLIPGDTVKISGGIRKYKNKITLNIEKLEVVDLISETVEKNPICVNCGGSMESMGTNKGYRCRKCRYRDNQLEKLIKIKERKIRKGIYLPDKNAHRHLTKPLERYGKEKKYFHTPLIKNWIG